MNSLKVAMIQAEPPKSLREALEVGIAQCDLAKLSGASLVLFPELWSHGYWLPETEADFEGWKLSSLERESYFIQSFKTWCRLNSVAVCLPFLETHEPKPKNSAILIDRHGEIVLHYSKVHTCSFGQERWLAPGDHFEVAELDLGTESIKVGIMICFDREFPESARVLALSGAEMILVPNACELENNREAQLRTRAFENMVGVAVANYCRGVGNGCSQAYDGVAFVPGKINAVTISRDHQIAKGSREPELVVAEFDLEQMRSYRNREVWGKNNRHPQSYNQIVVASLA